MKLITSRLILRPFEADDWHDLYAYLGDEDVVSFEPYEPFSEEKCKHEAKVRSKDDSFIAVCLADTGKLIGNLSLTKRNTQNCELGFVFSKQFWHQFYATEAVMALLQYLFSSTDTHRVYAQCNPQNHASVKLLKRLNMRCEGRFRQNESFHTDNATGEPIWQDTLLYAVLREEWLRSVK